MSVDTVGAGQEPGAETSSATGFSAEDRAELDRLRAENAEFRGTLTALAPHADMIRPLVEDEALRSEYQEYLRMRADLSQRKPQGYSPELQALRDEIVGEIAPMKEVVTEHRQQQQAAVAARKQAVFDEGKPIVMSHLEKNPQLRQSRAFAKTLENLQDEAVDSGRPFKEVWDTYVSGFAPERSAAPPRQLRAHTAEPGIPAAPTRKPQAAGERPQSVREAFMDAFKRVNGRAS